MNFLKQSTASQSRMIGPFVDDTDFKTLETGLTIANTDVKLCVNGGASANKNSGGGTHRVNGMYSLTFDATDTATVGEMEVSIAVSGALVVKKTFYVLEEAIFDSLFAASAAGFDANQRVNLGLWLGTAPLALSSQRVQADMGAISGDATAADNLEAALDGTGGVTITAGLTGNVTGNLTGSVGSVTGAVGSVTGNVGGNVTGSIGSLAAQAKADVNAEVDSALDTAIPGSPTANSINERIQTMDNAYTATRAGHLDNLSGGAVALNSTVAKEATLGTPAGASLAADIAAVKSDTAATLDDTGTSGVVVAAASKTGFRLSATGVADIWAYVVEGTWTAVMYMRLMASALFGKISGAGTTTVTIRDVDDSKNRIVATVDTDGNRSAFGTRDGT